MNKLLKVMIISLSIILLTAAVVIVTMFMILKDKPEDGQISIEMMNQLSFDTSEVTTDLDNGKFVRIQFKIIVNNKAALKEIEQRDFQMKNILIKELSVMEEADFKEGLTDLENAVKKKLNAVMEKGEIIEVLTISKILQ